MVSLPRLQGNALQTGVAITASVAFFLYGYDQGVYAGLINEPAFLRLFPALTDPVYASAVIAVFEVGALIGALGIACYGAKLGRRRCIALGSSLVFVGGALQATSYELVQMVVGRIVAGMGIGVISSTTPVWQSELARPAWRGTLVMIQGACIVLGVAVSYWLNFIMYLATNKSWQWRVPVALQLVPSLLVFLAIIIMPESPRWLLLVGRNDEAEDVVSRIYAKPATDEKVKDELDGMKSTVEAMVGFRWSDLLKNGPEMNRYRASVALAAQTFQQLAGTNLVTYFQTVLFRQLLGFDLKTSLILTAASGSEYFLSAILAIFLIERVGRRKLLLGTAVGQAIVMAGLGVCVYVKSEVSLWIAFCLIMSFNTLFAIGWQATTWLYCAELPNLKTRTTITALGACSNWTLNSIVVMAADPLMATIGGGTYLLFAAFNASFVPFIYFFFPETSGRGLEEIDLFFAKAHHSHESPVRLAAEMPHKKAEEAREELAEALEGESDEREEREVQNETRPLLQGERYPDYSR